MCGHLQYILRLCCALLSHHHHHCHHIRSSPRCVRERHRYTEREGARERDSKTEPRYIGARPLITVHRSAAAENTSPPPPGIVSQCVLNYGTGRVQVQSQSSQKAQAQAQLTTTTTTSSSVVKSAAGYEITTTSQSYLHVIHLNVIITLTCVPCPVSRVSSPSVSRACPPVQIPPNLNTWSLTTSQSCAFHLELIRQRENKSNC